MSRSIPLLLGGALAVATALAAAQPLFDPNSVVLTGWQIAKSVDSGHYAEIWDGASPVMKKVWPKAQFIESVAKVRQSLGAGAATDRVWADVSRRDWAGTAELPAGIYVNVGYQTTFPNGKSMRELVSFRLDEDKHWRVAGYVIN